MIKRTNNYKLTAEQREALFKEKGYYPRESAIGTTSEFFEEEWDFFDWYQQERSKFDNKTLPERQIKLMNLKMEPLK